MEGWHSLCTGAVVRYEGTLSSHSLMKARCAWVFGSSFKKCSLMGSSQFILLFFFFCSQTHLVVEAQNFHMAGLATPTSLWAADIVYFRQSQGQACAPLLLCPILGQDGPWSWAPVTAPASGTLALRLASLPPTGAGL